MASRVGRGAHGATCSKGGPTGASRGSGRGACRYRFSIAKAATKRLPIQRSSITSPISLPLKLPTRGTHGRKANCCPTDYKCAKCGGGDFRKETDILDVWFDSGSSCVAVLETRGETLRFPADVYLEGGDQYRGWFNSSLELRHRGARHSPYKQIITHGWVVDGEGKKQSKSLGNVTAPQEIIDKSGAEILRLWAAAVDYTEDVRCSDEILSRVVDAYRKMRNTLRYALGNLDGFDPVGRFGRCKRDARDRPLGARWT